MFVNRYKLLIVLMKMIFVRLKTLELADLA